MRTGPFAGRAGHLFDAQIALGGLDDGLHVLIHHEFAGGIPDFHHANGVVGSNCCSTRGGRSAGGGVDDDLAAEGIAMDGAGGTADHANGVHAVHTGIGDHDVAVGGGRGAGNAGLLSCAVEQARTQSSQRVQRSKVNIYHGGGAVEEAVLGEKFERVTPIVAAASTGSGGDFGAVGAFHDWLRQRARWERGEDDGFHARRSE